MPNDTEPHLWCCLACGQEWPRDPRLEVEYPACHAHIGNPCTFLRPSGHRVTAAFAGAQPHVEREEAAVVAGFMSRECPNFDRSRLRAKPVQTALAI